MKDKREDIEVCNSRRSDSCRVIARPDQGRVTHYKLAFENEWVQFVDVHYGPHEKSRMAEHPGGVVVVLTEGHLKFTDQNGKVQEVHAKPGESRWFPSFGHRVENLGDTAYNAVYLRIKTRGASAKPKRKACPKPRIPRRKGRNCDAERSMWVCRFSRCGRIPPLLGLTICEWRVLIARANQSMNTHPPA